MRMITAWFLFPPCILHTHILQLKFLHSDTGASFKTHMQTSPLQSTHVSRPYDSKERLGNLLGACQGCLYGLLPHPPVQPYGAKFFTSLCFHSRLPCAVNFLSIRLPISMLFQNSLVWFGAISDNGGFCS